MKLSKRFLIFIFYYFLLIIFIPSVLLIIFGDSIKGIGWAETFVLLGIIFFPSCYFFNTIKKIKKENPTNESRFTTWNMISLVFTLLIALILMGAGALLMYSGVFQVYRIYGDTIDFDNTGLFLNFLFAFVILSSGIIMMMYGFGAKNYISSFDNS